MRIEKLNISNFRNIENLELTDLKQINIIHGSNAQGKTSLIEALAFLSIAKSFRNDENNSLINFSSDFAKVEATIKKTYSSFKLAAVINKSGQKLFIDGKETKRLSDFIGNLNVVSFSPADVFLFKETPKKRRDFLDEELSKLSPSYYLAKESFNKQLKERNEALRSHEVDQTLLGVLTVQLAKVNGEIAQKRADFIERLSQKTKDKMKGLFVKEIKVEIEYLNQFSNDYHSESIQKLIEDNYEEDHYRRATQIGIQRDDFVFYLDGNPIAYYGSQGQNRLAAIALKLATIDLIKEKTGEKAVIILDDVLSELDKERQQRLLEILKNENQVFITSTQDYFLEGVGDEQILKKQIINGRLKGEK